MSVKDVLQSLVDDGMVDSDRIGTSNYFWAFPSKASNQVSIVCGRDCVMSLSLKSLNSSSHDTCMTTIIIYIVHVH